MLLAALSAAAQEPPQAPPTSAREVLAAYDLGPAQFSQFVDGRPLTPDEEPVLAKILLRFSRLGLANIHRWRKSPVDWKAIAAATHQEQGKLFAIRGRARLVNEHKLPPALAEQMEFARYYSVQIALDDAAQQALVYTRVVPKAWIIGQPIDEPAVADGLLLKLGEPTEGGQPLVFGTGRVGWLPKSSPLAGAGFDVSLFDAVRETNGKGLVAADREPFYQLLVAISRLEPTGPGPASAPLDVAALVQKPAEHHGELFSVRGTARRIVKVMISEAGASERLGLDHYYEIDLFVPLSEATLRFDGPKQAEKSGESPVFENTYPVTLIARQLPPGLAAGENLHEQIAADAVFFKLWTYESVYMARFSQNQPAPLFIAQRPRLIPTDAPSGVLGTAITALLVGVLAATFAAWWWYHRGDRFRRTPFPSARFPTPDH
ncbi:MAG: hypothetical protein L0211_00715 [Planctomycetaceae bacterium]|nr:hypothetical protein [Planctomycetaceae bacterium]